MGKNQVTKIDTHMLYTELRFLFTVAVITYIAAAGLEVVFTGFISNNFPLAWILWFVIILGFTVFFLRKRG